MREDLERFLHPTAVAIVGRVDAKADPESVLRPLRERFGDTFHLVDPAGGPGQVGDRPVHRRVADVPVAVDLAVLNVPRDSVVPVAEECGAAGVRGLIVTASGFGELDAEGAELERELLAAVRGHGMRMVGPNGSTAMFERLPAAANPRTGRIGLVTQSGHMGRLIFQSWPHGIAFSRWLPAGNEADLDAADWIEYFAYDEETAVIAGYFEGFRDGGKLRRALAAAYRQGKPVVLIKVGRDQAASRMAATHSAHLTGSDAAFDGLCRQYGVLRVDDVDELIETAALHAKLAPRPPASGVVLYGYAGGAVALMADVAQVSGVEVPALSEATRRRLREVLAPPLGVDNPVDPGNLYRGGTPEQRRRVLEAMGDDPAVGVVVCASTGVIPGLTDDFIGDIVEYAATSPKPVVVTWNTWEMGTPAYDRLVRSGIPIFRSFRNCFRALHGLFERSRRAPVIGAERPPAGSFGHGAPGGRLLPAEAAATLLAAHGVPLVPERTVRSAVEARAAADAVGLPAVAKVSLAEFPHKSDVGLVRTGLRSAGEVAAAFDELTARARELAPGADAPVLVQRQVEAGVEMIVGVTRDASLGPALLVGLGGVLAEIIRDVSVRPLPITRADAEEMVAELRGAPVLDGARGAPPLDRRALIDVLLAVAALAGEPARRVAALDLNPVIVTATGAVAVDWLVEVEAE